MPDVITGLACPNCSGTLTIQEGQRIIKCPYCEARSQVVGERGVRRYQVPRQVSREAAEQAVRGFWNGMNRAMDLGATAKINELFLVYLPYWRAQAQVAGWVLGRKRVGSGKEARWEPREGQVLETMEWNGAAGDVAEFGVDSVNMQGAQFANYAPDTLHAEGLVFEPTNSHTEALQQAGRAWEKQAAQKTGIEDVAQTFLRFLRDVFALVYYPLWVARYTYRQRVYQVVVDGRSGRVLYGKAPGNVLYRALMLVGGTSIGSFIMVNGTALAVQIAAYSNDDDIGWIVVAPFAIGAALMAGGFQLFRFGEEIEERKK